MKLVLLAAVLFQVCALRGEESVYDAKHTEAELPPGGEFIQHPKKSEIRYYWSNRPGQNLAGLCTSLDAGKTWNLLCYIFTFRKVFVHPETGVLYAIIDYTWLKEDKGYLVRANANKLVMSEDGRRWKDITRGRGYIADIIDVFQDPEHPQRVCMLTAVIRPTVFQASDDEYSKWTWYPAWEWEKRKHK